MVPVSFVFLRILKHPNRLKFPLGGQPPLLTKRVHEANHVASTAAAAIRRQE